MVIQIGGICAWLGTLSLISFLHYVHERKLKYSIICAIGSIFAILATLLSGARGAWLLTPFIMVLSLWAYKRCLERKKLAVALAAIALMLSVVAPQLKQRIDLVFQDIALYKQNQLSTSSGARIEMWKSAILTSMDYPILGVGHDGVTAQKLKQIEKDQITRDVLQFKRAHNQYLEELQTKGLVGVLALLVLFLVPLRWFYKKLLLGIALANSQLKALSLMGCMHILMIMGFCLTQHYLNHHSGILVFSFGLAILAALTIRSEEDSVQGSKETK
ncbi:O-antigen ligase family protein [Vibrio xiamenensis]|nr:O-antigen ligase family protein [Vibrio xiamenensis]